MKTKRAKRIFIIVEIIILVSIGGLVWYFLSENNQTPELEDTTVVQQKQDSVIDLEAEEVTEPAQPDKVTNSVPFASQAPFGDWDDPRQQDGCEEASIMMAMKWVKGESLSKQEALDEIISMAKFQEEKFGFSTDTSAADTLTILQEYYQYDKAVVKYDITIEDIKNELANGNILVLHVNGKTLNNPNFTGGGPERHALVVSGYNDKKQQFITNDPGTRKGEEFIYSYQTIANSLRDYPSGYKVQITNPRTVMTVIYPNS